MNITAKLRFRVWRLMNRKKIREQQQAFKTMRKKKMEDLETRIKAGMDALAGTTESHPLPPLPAKPPLTLVISDSKPITEEPKAPELTLSEIREQQIKEAMQKAALDHYTILKSALENCLMQSQHMREPITAVEACKQIESICLAALADLP